MAPRTYWRASADASAGTGARTLAAVATLVAVAELARLVDAGGGARGHDGAEGADVSGQVHLDRGVAARVQHLAGSDALDSAAATAQAEGLLAEHGSGRDAAARRALGREHVARRGEAGSLVQSAK